MHVRLVEGARNERIRAGRRRPRAVYSSFALNARQGATRKWSQTGTTYAFRTGAAGRKLVM